MFSKLGCAVVAGRSGLQPVPQQVVPVIQVITADGGLPAKSCIIGRCRADVAHVDASSQGFAL